MHTNAHRFRRLASTCGLLALAACPGGGGGQPVDAPPDLDCGDRLLAELRTPGGEYRRMDDAVDGAELVLGFQGFRYIYLRARLDRDPQLAAAAAVVQLDGGDPRSQPLHLTFAADGGGGVVSAPMQVFFNDDPLPELVDRGLTLHLLVSPACQTQGHTVLRYDPSCYEGPDGAPVCDQRDGAPDAGVGGGGA